MMWVRARLCKFKKGGTCLAAASDKVYQLLAHGRWFSPYTPASSTIKTGRHDIAEILLKVVLKHQKSKSLNQSEKTDVYRLGNNVVISRTNSKKSLKISKWKLESVNRRRTDNTMAKRKSTKGQTTINKTYI